MTTANIALCNVIDSTPDYGYITVYYNRKVFQSFHYLNHDFDFERFKNQSICTCRYDIRSISI